MRLILIYLTLQALCLYISAMNQKPVKQWQPRGGTKMCSFRLPHVTVSQLEELAAKHGTSKVQMIVESVQLVHETMLATDD